MYIYDFEIIIFVLLYEYKYWTSFWLKMMIGRGKGDMAIWEDQSYGWTCTDILMNDKMKFAYF